MSGSITTHDIVDWICIIMIILGTLGNSLGLIVFSSRKFRRTTYGKLAIASLIINLLCVFRYSLLLHSSTRRWIQHKAGQSWFNCKLYRMSSCLRILSAFVTVAWTYERFTYVTTNFHFLTNNQYVKKYKFYFMFFLSLIIITALTGPTIYFYQLKSMLLIIPSTISYENTTSITTFILPNVTILSRHTRKSDDLITNQLPNNSYVMICSLKDSISPLWRSFLEDVQFGLNYTTFRSIFSEIIPSLLVIMFNIGIIICVIESTLSFSSHSSTTNVRQNTTGSFRSKEGVDGLIVHNRPRTSWMNIVLIIHSCLFFFSSLTATIVHWSTSNMLLSHWISVVILANCSLNFYVYCLSGKSFRNEIRKLFYYYYQLCCFMKFMNLFRTKSQREQVRQTIRMRLVTHKSNVLLTNI
ncbi:unnamed protein product [Adineta steineri]|uniref:G-protein coupled receptors family 1 profile domain-containing protein n=1 Tax=Adineta steineri TaxID=433720 RepID=A0A814RR24_9BILA|nr:unnamed protein product [Adineta steineri]CAF3682819.1 unnamed protein product [Adineta steineri]